jgi:hypothetical protein
MLCGCKAIRYFGGGQISKTGGQNHASLGKLGPLLSADAYRVAPPNEPTHTAHTATQPSI